MRLYSDQNFENYNIPKHCEGSPSCPYGHGFLYPIKGLLELHETSKETSNKMLKFQSRMDISTIKYNICRTLTLQITFILFIPGMPGPENYNYGLVIITRLFLEPWRSERDSNAANELIDIPKIYRSLALSQALPFAGLSRAEFEPLKRLVFLLAF